MQMMTDRQMQRELSREYKEWADDPNDVDYYQAVEEVARLCEVIVGLRAKLRKARKLAKRGAK